MGGGVRVPMTRRDLLRFTLEPHALCSRVRRFRPTP
jgi:hypothetical protein